MVGLIHQFEFPFFACSDYESRRGELPQLTSIIVSKKSALCKIKMPLSCICDCVCSNCQWPIQIPVVVAETMFWKPEIVKIYLEFVNPNASRAIVRLLNEKILQLDGNLW